MSTEDLTHTDVGERILTTASVVCKKLVCALSVLDVVFSPVCQKRLPAGHGWVRCDECGIITFPRGFVAPRLSNASFVSCAAAVGGEKTAGSQPRAPSQSSNGKKTKKPPAGPSSDRSKGNSSGHEKDTPSVRVGGGIEVAEPPEGDSAPCGEASTIGVDAVAVELSRRARVPARRAAAPLYFAFDHCFSVRGQGTILTGTVLTGEVKVSAGSIVFSHSLLACC